MIEVLLVEDSRTDIDLMQRCLRDARIANQLNVVRNGADALNYLRRSPGYEASSRPDLVLLDLNLPKKNGLQVLEEMKADAALRSIPVVILTTSDEDEDVAAGYDLQAASFITKPPTIEGFQRVCRQLEGYWFALVQLPPEQEDGEPFIGREQ